MLKTTGTIGRAAGVIVGVRRDTGCCVENVIQAVDLLVVHDLAGHDGHGLGGLTQTEG